MADETRGDETFRYNAHLFPLVWACILVPLNIWLGVTWIERQGWVGGLLFLFVSLTFVLLVTSIMIFGFSDIFISNEKIVRKAFGVTWQEMKWVNITSIGIAKSPRPERGKIVRSFALRSSTRGSGVFRLRRIIFQESTIGMNALIDKLLSVAAAHQIPIADTSKQ